jgi:hypothetical protein
MAIRRGSLALAACAVLCVACAARLQPLPSSALTVAAPAREPAPLRSAPAAPRPAVAPAVPPGCDAVAQALALRDNVLHADVACLSLLSSARDLSFVKSAVVSGDARHAAALAPLARLHALAEISLAVTPLPSLGALSRLSKLRIVYILKPLATLAPLAALRRVQILSVDLSGARGRLADVSALSAMTSLVAFRTGEEVDLDAVARAAPGIADLYASAATRLDALDRFRALESLTLGCFTSRRERVTEPPKLRTLVVECDERGAPFEPLANFADVEELDLSRTQVRSLGGSRRLKNLRRLDLRGTGVGNVLPLARMKTLKELVLPGRCDRPDAVALMRRRRDVEVVSAADAPCKP